MGKFRWLTSVMICVAICSVAIAEPKDRVTIKPEAEKYQSAKTIDFAYELDLSFDSLSKLGTQIEDARTAADPVGLVAAANLLKVAETVSKSKAKSLTSEALTKEAVDLAKLREIPKELETVSLLTGDKELTKLAKVLQEEQSKDPDETDKNLNGDLHVHNHSHEGFAIYANGRYLGYVGPHCQREWHLHHVHYLDARNNYHRIHRHIHGNANHYDFYLHTGH